MDSTALHAVMSKFRYGVVSSLSRSGAPQSALVGIAVTPELDIVFDTVKPSRKYANLLADPRCSMVIGWSGEQTLQLEGLATEPHGGELTPFQKAYFAVWPECREHLSWPGITYLVVRPTWIRYSDFDQRPPLIEEMVIDPAPNVPMEGKP
jgi:hypothetical protein